MINKKNILDHEIRQEIFKCILKNPGLHFSELSRKLDMPKSTLDYHINFLRKNNFISIRNDKNLKRFYVYGKVGTKDKNLLGFLRRDIPFKIIINLLFPGYCSETELSKDLKLAFSTINFHISKLQNKDIIKKTERKNFKFDYPLENKAYDSIKKPGRKEIFYTFKNPETTEDICRLLTNYKSSLAYPGIIDEYCDFIEEGNQIFENKKNIKDIDFDSIVDNLIDLLNEIFPILFHT